MHLKLINLLTDLDTKELHSARAHAQLRNLITKVRDHAEHRNDSPLSSLENRDDQIRKFLLEDILAEGRKQISAIFARAGRDIVQKEDHYKLSLEELCEIVGFTLFLCAYLCRTSSDEIVPFDFYFWPGYDKLKPDGSVERFQLSADHQTTGIGFRITHPKNLLTYRACAASYWFSKALDPDAPHFKAEMFIPGGTHAFVVANKELVEKKNRLHVEVLHIEAPHNGNMPSGNLRDGKQFPDSPDMLLIQLPDNRSEWAESISAKLSEDAFIVDSDHFAAWPHHSDYKKGQPHVECFQSISKSLYNLWLTACFDPKSLQNPHDVANKLKILFGNKMDKCQDCSAMLGKLRKSLIKAIADRNLVTQGEGYSVSRAETESAYDHQYRHWYTFCLRPTSIQASVLEPSSLGSAMCLCSHELTPHFFSHVYEWLNEIMRDIRIGDASRISRVRAKDHVIRSFSHELKTFPDALRQSIVSAKYAFEIVTDETLAVRGKMGCLHITPGMQIDAIGVTPFLPEIRGWLDLMALWMGTRVSKEFFDNDIWPASIQALVSNVWRNCVDGFPLFACPQDFGMTGDLLELEKFRKRLENIRNVYGRMSPAVICECSFKLNYEAKETSWFIRLLLALFHNCIKHGDPARQCELTLQSCGGGRYMLSLTNYPRLSTSTASNVGAAVNEISKAVAFQASLTRGSTEWNTYKVINECLEALKGALREDSAINESGAYIIKCEFSYEG